MLPTWLQWDSTETGWLQFLHIYQSSRYLSNSNECRDLYFTDFLLRTPIQRAVLPQERKCEHFLPASTARTRSFRPGGPRARESPIFAPPRHLDALATRIAVLPDPRVSRSRSGGEGGSDPCGIVRTRPGFTARKHREGAQTPGGRANTGRARARRKIPFPMRPNCRVTRAVRLDGRRARYRIARGSRATALGAPAAERRRQ